MFFYAKYDRAYPPRRRLEMLDADLGTLYISFHGRLNPTWNEDCEITGFSFDHDYGVVSGPLVRAERSMRLGGKDMAYAEYRFRLIGEILETQFGDDLPMFPPADAWRSVAPRIAECTPKRFR